MLNIDLEDYKVSKGFLAQAKTIDPHARVPPADIERMVVQCEQMLSHTPDSFLFLYSMQGIFVVPAVSVVGGRFSNPHDLYARSLSRFYEEHFECFIGDGEISSPSPQMLDGLRERLRVRTLSYLAAQRETTR